MTPDPASINRHNRSVWRVVSVRSEEYLKVPEIRAAAFDRMQRELDDGLDVRQQTNLAILLQEAARAQGREIDICEPHFRPDAVRAQALIEAGKRQERLEEMLAKAETERASLEASLARAKSESAEEQARLDAVRMQAKKEAIAEQARRGGLARKGSALTRLIDALVSRKPDLSQEEALDRLRNLEGHGLIHLVSETHIILMDDETVPISGLKDRLYRARKKLRSR